MYERSSSSFFDWQITIQEDGNGFMFLCRPLLNPTRQVSNDRYYPSKHYLRRFAQEFLLRLGMREMLKDCLQDWLCTGTISSQEYECLQGSLQEFVMSPLESP